MSRTFTDTRLNCDRICPGRHFAEASMFILAASVLYAFDIRPPKDANGQPIVLEHEAAAMGVIA